MTRKRLSPVLIQCGGDGDEGPRLLYKCACGSIHSIFVGTPNGGAGPARWTWDGNVEAPTFSPSINTWAERHKRVDGKLVVEESREVYWRCHHFVVAGLVNFCEDCTHEKKGQQGQPLLPISDDYLYEGV